MLLCQTSRQHLTMHSIIKCLSLVILLWSPLASIADQNDDELAKVINDIFSIPDVEPQSVSVQ